MDRARWQGAAVRATILHKTPRVIGNGSNPLACSSSLPPKQRKRPPARGCRGDAAAGDRPGHPRGRGAGRAPAPGRDPDEADEILARLLFCTHHTLPDSPVSAVARLSALPPFGDAVDRVSRLPDALLRGIVSLLPVKDAARTAALSRRWRGVWRSAPLVLADADLSPSPAAPAPLSRVLEAHPGPFCCVHLTGSCTEESRHLLAPWLQLLAAKAVQELVLANSRRPLDVVPPATFLRTATLTRLHLCFWRFPSTAGLPPSVSFPNLRELGLYSVVMESRDLDFMLDRSPVLETLCLEGNLFTLRLRLVKGI